MQVCKDERFLFVRCFKNPLSYGFRPLSEVGDLSGITHVPFQVQLLFRRADGTKVLRVATARIELTADRSEAEKGADIKVVATHAAQSAAAKAKKVRLCLFLVVDGLRFCF